MVNTKTIQQVSLSCLLGLATDTIHKHVCYDGRSIAHFDNHWYQRRQALNAHWSNAVLMLGHRRWRWTNIKTALAYFLRYHAVIMYYISSIYQDIKYYLSSIGY